MESTKIRSIWNNSYQEYSAQAAFQSDVQKKASRAIMNCKTGALGMNLSKCPDCGYLAIHNNSCRNRNCPNCQAVTKELWVDSRRAEVIDAPYFHVVFTLPHELNSLVYCNQSLLYNWLHQCCAQTILELSADSRHLGATPGIIQVLHTWDQELNYHVHMHCIVSGGGITPSKQIKTVKNNFFIRVEVLRDKFKGKFLAGLEQFHKQGKLFFSESCLELRNSYSWNEFRNSLYSREWCPYIKETFNGFGNAIEYLGRYTHKVAISNSRIISVDSTNVTFSARSKVKGEPRRVITLSNTEFIRRYLMHVLPHGFRKIRYYGFLNNRMKSVNLRLIFKLQGHQRFRRKYVNMTFAEQLRAIWGTDIRICPACGCCNMKYLGRCHASPS